jgi:hypothetical protein
MKMVALQVGKIVDFRTNNTDVPGGLPGVFRVFCPIMS